MQLGMIGLGNIGAGVCANLLDDGHRVTALDVDAERLRAQVDRGAAPAASPGEVAAASEITLLSLPSPETMAAVSEAWLEGAQAGKILVDLTTNSPATVRRVGARVAASDARLLEAPVTGGAPGARNRQLLFIVGGDEDLVEEVSPLLRSLGRGVCHMGPLGSGNVGKLVNSLLAFSSMWTALEGLALAAGSGVDLRTLVDMLRTAGGAHSYIERRVEEITERGRHPDFAMELAAKDAGLMVELGREVAVPVPLASAVHQMLVYGKAQGLGGRDISDLVEVMERAAGLDLELRAPSES